MRSFNAHISRPYTPKRKKTQILCDFHSGILGGMNESHQNKPFPFDLSPFTFYLSSLIPLASFHFIDKPPPFIYTPSKCMRG
jgi:hypothetical protein